jgi:hypothetical protein
MAVMDDLETVALRSQLEILQHRFREAGTVAHNKADDVRLSDEARYWSGYADAMYRAEQALRELGEQW